MTVEELKEYIRHGECVAMRTSNLDREWQHIEVYNTGEDILISLPGGDEPYYISYEDFLKDYTDYESF